VVVHAAKGEAASRGSTGEQKALLIAIVLAHAALVAARTGRPPLLLLDEIAAHLDAARRAALFAQLAATGSQVWMTGTDPSLFDSVGPATRLRIAGGVVMAA
jgi:DNA replication and repair protein RecF